MGRPREYHQERIGTALRIPPDLHGRLKEAAGERGVSVNRLILLAAEDFLGRLIPVEEFSYTRPADRPEPPPTPAAKTPGPASPASCPHPKAAQKVKNDKLGLKRCEACGSVRGADGNWKPGS